MAAIHPVLMDVLIKQIHILLTHYHSKNLYSLYRNSRKLILQRDDTTKKGTHRSAEWPVRVLWSVQRSKAVADTGKLLMARISVISIRTSGYVYAWRNLTPLTDHAVNQRLFRENILAGIKICVYPAKKQNCWMHGAAFTMYCFVVDGHGNWWPPN